MRHIAALSAQIPAGEFGGRLHLLPAGDFVTSDGLKLRLRPEDAERVIGHAAALANKLVLDYEHQSIWTLKNGQPAPAAGWFKQLEFAPSGDHPGLYATDVTLTAKAREMVEAVPPEYGYVSSVVEYELQPDGYGAVTRLRHAALTNTPAVDGLRAVAALKSSLEQPTVSLTERLIAALSLAADATEDDIVTEVTKAKEKAENATSEVAALKSATPDPAKYAPVAVVTELQTQLAALKGRVDGQEADTLIADAIAAGKPVSGETEKWLRDLAKASGIAALKTHLDSVPVIAALKGSQTGGKKPAGTGATEPDAEQIAICKAMGISLEAFKQAAAKAAA